MPETPDLGPDDPLRKPRHMQRIKCPALFVGGAIVYAANAVPDIVIQAQRRIMSEPPIPVERY